MTLNSWFLAIRPKTLSASIAPVVIGTAMAYGHGIHHFPSALAALAAALLIQIGTNLANDYFDFKKGVDTKDRRGPARVTQSGLISPMAVKWAYIICFFLAVLVSCYLIARVGWPVVVIGALSLLAGIFYTAGPKPLSHLGLGDAAAFVFFGPVAVVGTYYVQSFEWNWAVVTAGLAPGFFSTAILTVNNLRDIETDARAGKRTLAVRFGPKFARLEYLTCVAAACFVPLLVHMITDSFPWSVLASLTFFMLLPAFYDVFTSAGGRRLNRALAMTGLALFIYSLVFAIPWIM